MELPVFFAKGIGAEDTHFRLDANASRHCIVVLRRKAGDKIILADGRGGKFQATIMDDHWKKTAVSVDSVEQVPPVGPRLEIAIGFTKNASRMEWFLEKATEIGISGIYPLLSRRSEKEKFRPDRFENILSSAMLQSGQYYLPQLHQPLSFEQLVRENKTTQRFIAHCIRDEKNFLQEEAKPGKDTLILVGPEGDFTPEEISLALHYGYRPVSLGPNRLRTETAGVVACVLMNAANAKF